MKRIGDGPGARHEPALAPAGFQSGKGYGRLVDDIGALLQDARRVAARRVNTVMVETYWRIGRRIVEYEQAGKKRAVYGEMLIFNLSRDLSARYGRGFDVTNIRHMRKFYILHQKRDASRPESRRRDAEPPKLNLAWTHYRMLMGIKDGEKRRFYETQCERAGWSVRQLARQIDVLLYERLRLARSRGVLLARADGQNAPVRPEDEIKDPLVLDFLDIPDDHSESELEDALIRHLQDFLLELGAGFAFVGRQKTIFVGNQRFKVDLVFYHMGLRCLVLIDLKVGAFTHADAGQMNFYINYFRENMMNPDDNPPVGMILCADKDDAVVRYALGGMRNRIFASRYRLGLPDEEVLRNEILRERERFLGRRAGMAGLPPSGGPVEKE